ncbi:MAG: hypothetical protein RL477_1221 [Pseudomonadota bacterium]|jgi:predicted Rossmann fold flavoprotein
MCAATAGARGRRVLLLDHAERPGEKIRISGGGRCNFTNVHASPQHYISDNPRFCASALAGYTPADFIALVERYAIAWHEKTLGQLFCDGSATQIVDMLLAECRNAGVDLRLGSPVSAIARTDAGFALTIRGETLATASLVIATGGKSIPKMGATGFGYDVARQFGLNIVEPRPGLVPLVFEGALKAKCAALSGVSVDAEVSCGKARFREALLFTHRGLSGPAILQISSYWREGREIVIDLVPGTDVFACLKSARAEHGRQEIRTALAAIMPRRLAEAIAEDAGATGARLADTPDAALRKVAAAVNDWRVLPAGTEGYRTAEVTLGGVDTRELSSRTFEARKVPGLYFIGEVVDVTGHLGGYNFQWAWASGHACGLSARGLSA